VLGRAFSFHAAQLKDKNMNEIPIQKFIKMDTISMELHQNPTDAPREQTQSK
jgi:hypothetical protein